MNSRKTQKTKFPSAITLATRILARSGAAVESDGLGTRFSVPIVSASRTEGPRCLKPIRDGRDPGSLGDAARVTP
jgi:hypothetical protein